MFDSDDNLVAQLVLDDGSGGSAGDPQLGARASSGRFVVAWQRQPGQVVARSFDDNGGPEGDAIIIDDGSSGTAAQPAVAVNEAGDVVVAWARQHAAGEHDVLAQPFEPHDEVGFRPGP